MSKFFKQPAIFSHQRSGRWFYTGSICKNYDITNHEIYKYHLGPWGFEDEHWSVIENQFPICVHRDGRDVLTSLWYWSMGSGKPVEGNVQWNAQRSSFSVWLRSGPSHYTIDDTNEGEMPVEYWARYTQEMLKIGEFFHTKYEDLHLSNYEGGDHPILVRIGEECKLGRKPAVREICPVAQGVGHMPRKKVIGDYKNHFNENDLSYFVKIAGDVMDKLFPGGW